jgi:glucoamylase
MPQTHDNADASAKRYAPAAPGVDQVNLAALAPYMLALMLRNVASDGFIFEDPVRPGQYSIPGCIIAAPSYPANTPGVDQDYVFNWTRDSAITAMEIAAAHPPQFAGRQKTLIDYVNFAKLCAGNAVPTLAHASFTIEGLPRPLWSDQNDGPALQTLALLAAYNQLDTATQAVANALILQNVQFLLAVYPNSTTNLWEEHYGLSFFARAAQLRCFREVASNAIGVAPPAGLQAAIAWLEAALAGHWNGAFYVSVAAPDGAATTPVVPGYDPNIDIVSAALYGGASWTDTKLLATAALLRQQWSDPNSPVYYPINGADAARGMGPVLGRYPGDVYDGDVSNPVPGGHPWAVCTANFAEFYYRLAASIAATRAIPFDALSAPFFAQVGISAATSADTAASALRASGDAMLRAIVLHSDFYELSEQFDGTTGLEKSVRNLTWSYAAFLSALRARW